VCGGVHSLVNILVCSVARGGDDKSNTSVLLRSVGVCESGKDGGINKVNCKDPRNIYSGALPICVRRGGPMVCALDSGPGGQGAFLGTTLYSDSASFHPGPGYSKPD